MLKEIKGFFGDYRFLSNFWFCSVLYEGLLYPTLEHAYQAAKTLDLEYRKEFLTGSAQQAKWRGSPNNPHMKLRPDWEAVKDEVMFELLLIKFRKPSYRAKLLATGDAYLEETNSWNDQYWGVCRGKGKNMLGQLLMLVRDILNAEDDGVVPDIHNEFMNLKAQLDTKPQTNTLFDRVMGRVDEIMTGAVEDARRNVGAAVSETCCVLNKRFATQQQKSNGVLIDRTTKWGNPFKVGRDAQTNEEAVKLFTEYLDNNPELKEAAKRELKGKDLICWCKPKACHGDVYLKVANENDES